MIMDDRTNRFVWLHANQVHPVLLRVGASGVRGRNYNNSLFVNAGGGLEIMCFDAGKDIVGEQQELFGPRYNGDVPQAVPDTKLFVELGQLDSLCWLLGMESFSSEIEDPDFNPDDFLLRLFVAARINPALALDDFDSYRELLDTLASSYYMYHEIFIVRCGYDPDIDWSET